MTRTERAFAILLILSDRRVVTAAELATRFEVSIRTIYRDVEMLSETGVPVYAERGMRGGYRLLEGYFLPPVAFTRAEAVAALMGLAVVRSLRAPPYALALDSAERKLVAALPSKLRPILAETGRLIGVEPPATDAFHPEMPSAPPADLAAALKAEGRAIETFLDAVLDGTLVRLTYATPYRDGGTAETIEAAPLGVLWDRDRWYLLGRRASGGSERMWRADRVTAIEPSMATVAPDPRFDVRAKLGRRWLTQAMEQWAGSSPVRLRLTTAQADRLRGDWYFRHAAFRPDMPGTVYMTYGENDPAKVFELVRWLGPGAELLEPKAWRERLCAELAAMAELYYAG